VKEPLDAGCVTQVGVESKRRFMSHPASSLWLKVCLQIRTHVEIARSRSTTEPFHRTASGKVYLEVLDADRNRVGGLISVEHNHRTDLMRSVGDGFCVLQKTTFEKYMGKGHE